MFQVSVEETCSAGHALRGYKGKCENPHGHNYRVQVTLEGPQLDNIGLLVDFTQLKHVVRDIIKRLDHQFINDLEPFSWVVACGLPDVAMTSLALELPAGGTGGVGCFRRHMAFQFANAHGRRQRLVTPRRLGIDTANPSPLAERALEGPSSAREAVPA